MERSMLLSVLPADVLETDSEHAVACSAGGCAVLGGARAFLTIDSVGVRAVGGEVEVVFTDLWTQPGPPGKATRLGMRQQQLFLKPEPGGWAVSRVGWARVT
jgi:hypothetical protein